MANCKFLEGCPFFNDMLGTMPDMAEKLKDSYCKDSQHSDCARYMVLTRLGRENVPNDLFPHETIRAEEILRPKD